jgi:hypothetical protein
MFPVRSLRLFAHKRIGRGGQAARFTNGIGIRVPVFSQIFNALLD